MPDSRVPDEFCGKVKIEMAVSCEVEVTPEHALDDILSSFIQGLAKMGLNVEDIYTEEGESILPTKKEG